MTRRGLHPLASSLLLATLTASACDKSEPAPQADAKAEAQVETPADPAANAPEADPQAKAQDEPTPQAPEPELAQQAQLPAEPADPSFADAVATQAGEQKPSDAAKEQAWTHYKAKQFADAKVQFGLAALHEPGNWKHPFNLACAAALDQDELMVRVALREALARDPGTVMNKAPKEGDLEGYANKAWFIEMFELEPAEDPELAGEDALQRNLEDPQDIPLIPATAVATKVAWREVTRPSEPLALVVLAGGVLAKGSSGYYDVSANGQLVLRTEIEAPKSELLGYWPKNAWYVEQREKKREKWDDSEEPLYEVRLMRLRQGRRWVPQAYLDEQRWELHGERIQLAGKGGLLVYSPDFDTTDDRDDAFFTRVADTSDDAFANEHLGELVHWTTTQSGRFYSITSYKDRLVATKACEDEDCAGLNMAELPKSAAWTFGEARPRKRHSVSMVATHGGSETHLLHYESGGWKLNPLPKPVTGLWATKDGGLWVQMGEALWHRDPSGSWRDIQLPEGASKLSVGMRGDFSELWIAVDVGGQQVVFASAANAQAPAG